jgi:cytochrome b561
MATIFGGQGKYDRVARTLHWGMAALVLFNLAGGLLNDAIEDVVRIIPIHKATGILILALTLIRIGWRLTHRPPPLPTDTPRIERAAAHAVHLTLYGLMLAMPLTGWIMSSAGPYPIDFFGLFDVPKFDVARGDPVVGLSRGGHERLGWLMLALAVLHIAAALRHHLILKDGVLRRMA